MTDALIIFLIILGAGMMLISIFETRHLLQFVRDNKYYRAWQILALLMILFLFGYVGFILLVLADLRKIIFILTGLIFFFGSLFVYLVVRTGSLTLQDLLITKIAKIELEHSKETAEQIARTKSEFLATMSHELRTPLNGVIGMSDLLATTELNEEQQEFIEIIQTSSQSLLSIINDILDFSKIEVGKTELDLQPVHLRNAVEEVLDIVSSAASEKNLEIIYFIPPNVPEYIQADAMRLQQVLLNLVSNAVKFTPTGEVFVQVSFQDNFLHFTIKDTGIGIPPEKRDRLFQPFSQVDSSTTRQYGGTGLGLAISKKIVELMGGGISVESTVKQGTTFSFSFPYIPVTEIPVSELHPAITELKNKRVLIVDDNATNRRILTLQCQSWEMETYSCEFPTQALELLKKTANFDIAILDFNMPEMDGRQLAREIQEISNCQDLPLILLSSAQQNQFPQDNSLFATTLLKPVKQEQLLRALQKALGEADTVVKKSQTISSLASKKPGKILVAEDNVVNQKLIKLFLGKMGYDIDLVETGEEVLHAVEDQDYDLIFMDVQMPQMDGIIATQQLIQRYPDSKRPIIVAMTANAMEGDRQACLDAGMSDYISKPVKLEAIEKAIQKWMP